MTHSDDLQTVNVRLPDGIVAILDNLVKKGLFSSRSEAIREFARQYVEHHG
ncbi:MAG: ribbon-helix-helix domain-containing protein [Candidatus Woesearchaeota archaeon]|nr:ribbon-helix-helix domain-containing protein [Candidatus Woesearchaeota archaeon]